MWSLADGRRLMLLLSPLLLLLQLQLIGCWASQPSQKWTAKFQKDAKFKRDARPVFLPGFNDGTEYAFSTLYVPEQQLTVHREDVTKTCYVIRGLRHERPSMLYPISGYIHSVQMRKLTGNMVADFCVGYRKVIAVAKPTSPHKGPGDRKRRDASNGYAYQPRGRYRGQTQSQYLNFGVNNSTLGKAEAESTREGSRAVVSGTNGMGQAQSQSFGSDCEDCYDSQRSQNQALSLNGRGYAGTGSYNTYGNVASDLYPGTAGEPDIPGSLSQAKRPGGNGYVVSPPVYQYGDTKRPGDKTDIYSGYPGGAQLPDGKISQTGGQVFTPGKTGVGNSDTMGSPILTQSNFGARPGQTGSYYPTDGKTGQYYPTGQENIQGPGQLSHPSSGDQSGQTWQSPQNEYGLIPGRKTTYPSIIQPGQGQFLPGQNQLQGGQGRIQPGSGQLQPGQGQSQPGQGQLQPGQGQLQPGHGQLQPGQGQLQPGQGQPQQGYGQLQPGQGQLQHGQGRLHSGQGQLQTGQGQLQPGQGQLQHGQGQLQPSQRQPQTGYGQLQPGYGQPQSGQGQLYSGQGQLQTGQGQLQPGQEQLRPGQDKLQTGRDQTLGGPGNLQTGKNQLQYGQGQLQPGYSQSQPDQGQFKPGYDQFQPGHGRLQPGQGQLQPGQGQLQPGPGQQQTGYGQPQPGQGQGQLHSSQGQLLSGQGRLKPGQGLLQPGQGQPQPGYGQQQPGQGQLHSGQGQLQPGQGQPQPGYGQLQPGYGQLQPGQGQLHSGQGQLQPGQGRLQPGQGQLQPGQGQQQLGHGQLQHGQGQLQPGQGQLQPGQGQPQQGYGHLQPGYGQLQPEQGQGQLQHGQGQLHSGQEQLQSGQGQLQPGQRQPQTGYEQLQPGYGQPQLGQGQLYSGQGQLQSGQSQSQPGQGQLHPGQDRLQPGQGQLQPGQGQPQPGYGQLQPGQGQLQPIGGGLYPGSGQLQPGVGQDQFYLSQGQLQPGEGQLQTGQGKTQLVPGQLQYGQQQLGGTQTYPSSQTTYPSTVEQTLYNPPSTYTNGQTYPGKQQVYINGQRGPTSTGDGNYPGSQFESSGAGVGPLVPLQPHWTGREGYDGYPQTHVLQQGGVRTDGVAAGEGPGSVSEDNSQAEATLQHAQNETQASASSMGAHEDGVSQTKISGSYSGSGSFSAQAQSSDRKRGAQSQISVGKTGAMSSAQGTSGYGQSQAQLLLGADTGATKAQANSRGWNHGTNTQVQTSEKGGMADAQANGPGITSSQAQIGFQPYQENNKDDNDDNGPFRGGGAVSAQSGKYAGQSQAQIHGKFKYSISYNGGAQAESGTQDGSLNRTAFKPLDIFNRNPQRLDREVNQFVPSDEADDNSDPTKMSIKKSMSETESKRSTFMLTNQTPELNFTNPGIASHQSPMKSDNEESEDKNMKFSNSEDYEDGDDDEEYDGDFSSSTDIANQKVQYPYNPKEVVVQQAGKRQKQHIILGPLGNNGAHVVQDSASNELKEGMLFQPGEVIPGTQGYTIPIGFRGRVTSVSGNETYSYADDHGESQAQTVTLTPGSRNVTYSEKPVKTQSLRSWTPGKRYQGVTMPLNKYNLKNSPENYVTVTKSITGTINADKDNRAEDKQFTHTYYTKSSTCGYFTFSCNTVYGTNGRTKICRPKAPINPDGSPVQC